MKLVLSAQEHGSGIAQAFAQTEGYEVMLCDINETFAANGKKKIAAGFEKRIAKGKMTQELLTLFWLRSQQALRPSAQIAIWL